MLKSVADLDLIKRYASAGDPDAFAEIVRRHTAMVYHTCLRVLHDRTQAEDASQDTFFRLMRAPATVNRSLGAWLHKTATRRCLDVLRSETARRRREREHQFTRSYYHGRANPPSWSILSPQIDQALTQLPETTRTLLIEHFLAGKSQRQLAKETRTSTATVCRRIKAGLLQLRKQLGDAGFVVTAAALTSLFASQSSLAAPGALTAELGKMAMVSGDPAALGSVGTHIGPVSLKAATVTTVGATALCLAFYGVVHLGNGRATVIPAPQQAEAYDTHLNSAALPYLDYAEPQDLSGADAQPLDVQQNIYIIPPAGHEFDSQRVVTFQPPDADPNGPTIVGFADGHVSQMPAREADQLIREQTGRSMSQLMQTLTPQALAD